MSPRAVAAPTAAGPDLFQLFKNLKAERGLTDAQARQVVEEMIRGALERKFGKGAQFELVLKPEEKVFRLIRLQRVVTVVADPVAEISLEAAREEDPEFEVGDLLETPIDPTTMGRYASFAGKDAMRRQTRVFLHDDTLATWKEKVGSLVVVKVSRVEHGTAWCMIEGAPALEIVLPQREQSRGRPPKEGDTMEVAILEIADRRDVIRVVVSEGGPGYVTAVLKSRIPAESFRRIEFVKVVREAGVATKLVVRSADPEFDAVAAVVGRQGTLLQKVAQDVGERIDVLPWTDDLEDLVERALAPAEITEVRIEENNRITVMVHDSRDRREAVGERGSNVRLASQIVGRDITIEAEIADTGRGGAGRGRGAPMRRRFTQDDDEG